MNSSGKFVPIMTEKSMKLAKEGGFTFWVPMDLNKIQIKEVIGNTYSVTVTEVRTLNMKGGIKRNVRGQLQRIKSGKKAIVFLKPGEKIDLFEEEKKPVKKAKKSKADKKGSVSK